MNPKSAAQVSNAILRAALGVTMVMIGVSAYRDLAPFIANVTDGLGMASNVGYVWAFILPALLIFGGGMLAIGRYSYVAAWSGGLALASVPIGVVLKTIMTGLPLPDMLTVSYPSIVWLVAFTFACAMGPEEEAPATEEEE
jgi:hypothetical protein